MKKLLNQLLLNIFKGEEGEKDVAEAITRLLRNGDESGGNFFLIPKFKVPGLTGQPHEIDLVLLHPTLGLFIIEVKNWRSLKHLNHQGSTPFEQASRYKQLMMAYLQDSLPEGKLPINVEARVIFPAIPASMGQTFFDDNPHFTGFRSITFFQDDLNSRDRFERFFSGRTPLVPTKKSFLAVARCLLDKKRLHEAEQKVLPVITQDEILFFDHKQLSILDGYTGGFRIIRGVAGTGKTVILTNFVINRTRRDETERFLVLAFNRRLQAEINEIFQQAGVQHNAICLSLFALLKRIHFDWQAIGVDKDTPFNARMKALKTSSATAEFKSKLRQRLATHPIDYFLCDETQDMPPNIMRVLYEEIGDCIFFIDEAQRFYDHAMTSIAEVFHHPEFEKISMRGRVKNLWNVYRTPSNIAQCAFSILSNDRKLNEYYKTSHYLRNNFLKDIRFVLQKGELKTGPWLRYRDLLGLIKTFPTDQKAVILVPRKEEAAKIDQYLESSGVSHYAQAMTYKSIKGLEAENVILYRFTQFLEDVEHHDPELLYRSAYVVMTRALERLYVCTHFDNPPSETIQGILAEITQYETGEEDTALSKNEKERDSHRLAKLRPVIQDVKETSELVVAASEIFALIAGTFSL